MFAERRRLLLAGVAILAVAAGAWWQTRPAPTTAVVARAARPQRPPEPEAAAIKPLRLEVLTAARGEPSGEERNPFRFQARVVPPPRQAAPPPAPTGEARPAPPGPTGPPPAPPIALKFIALVERANGVKWAVMSDGKVTMYGKDGDTIDGRYRIVKIGDESVEVTHLDGRGRQVIRLTGQ
jgi:hypothetical protein